VPIKTCYINDYLPFSVREGEGRGVSIGGPSTLSVVEGQSVELICSANGMMILLVLINQIFLR
jgi:hypothetical protein